MQLTRRQVQTILPASLANFQQSSVPWHQRIRRVGQVNFSERDVAEADVEQWADYWATARVEAVQINVTGMIAFYPSKVPFHKHSRYLNGRDFFGECARAAKARGLRVIGRFSPDLQWEDALAAKPEWFVRDREGQPVPPFSRTPRLYQTCMFSTYYTEFTPAVMREVNALYPIDALYANGWPNWNMPECYCNVCRKLPPPGSQDYFEQFMQRAIELWKLYDGIAKEKSRENQFFGNLGGGIRSGLNLKRLAEVCDWFNADNQGRGSPAPAWLCSQQGRVAWSVMKGKTTTNVTGAWSTGSPMWRNAAKSPAEAELWMAQTAASGMAIWYHWLGAQTGLGEDRRWQAKGHEFLPWHAQHHAHFLNRRPIADIGVLLPQRTLTFHKSPADTDPGDHIQGFYSSLLNARHTFAFVHEDDLTPETLAPFPVVILPNAAWLSARQCNQLEAYVAAGGSLLADFETSLFDENGRARQDFGLAGLFGIGKAGEPAGARGFQNSFYARIERPHPVLEGFLNTNWVAGCEWRVPLRPVEQPVLTVVPPYPAYPTEVTYTETMRTHEPALALREHGRGRTAYFCGDLGRTIWRSGHPDAIRLFSNTLAWLLGRRRTVEVRGNGLLELHAWETEPGFALHLLNYQHPNLHRGVYLEPPSLGPQQVDFTLPANRRIRQVRLCRTARDLRFTQEGRTVRFQVPDLATYEMVTLI